MSDTEAHPVSTTAPRIDVPDNAVWFGYVSSDSGDMVPVAVIRHYGTYLPQYHGRIMWHEPTTAHGYRIMAAWALDPMRNVVPVKVTTSP